MKEVKAVIFDMDGLMFDTEKMYYETSQETADELGIPYDKDLYSKFLGLGYDVVKDTYHDLYDEKFGREYVDKFIEDSEKKMFAAFKTGDIENKKGLLELLDYLEEEGIPKVVASSNDKFIIEMLLASKGLTSRFSHIVSADDVDEAKPNPEIFLKAKGNFDFDPENVLVLEDSDNGVLAAHRAGIPVIMVPDLIDSNEELEAMTEEVLEDLGQVIDFINEANN